MKLNVVKTGIGEEMSDEELVNKLNDLIEKYREVDLVHVLPQDVLPCTTNREKTGISSYHVHYLADKIQREGFLPRCLVSGDGHDLPIGKCCTMYIQGKTMRLICIYYSGA